MHGGGGLGALGGGLGLGGPGAASGVGPAGGAGPKAPENQNLLQFLSSEKSEYKFLFKDRQKAGTAEEEGESRIDQDLKSGKVVVVKEIKNDVGKVVDTVKYTVDSVQAQIDSSGSVITKAGNSYQAKINWKISLKLANILDKALYDAKERVELTLEDNHTFGQSVFTEADRVQGAPWQLTAYISSMKMPLISDSNQWRTNEVIKQLANNEFQLKKPKGDQKFVAKLTTDTKYGKKPLELGIQLSAFKVNRVAGDFFEIKPGGASRDTVNLSKFVDELATQVMKKGSGLSAKQAELIDKFNSLEPTEEPTATLDDIGLVIRNKDQSDEYADFLKNELALDQQKVELHRDFFSDKAQQRGQWKTEEEDTVTTIASYSRVRGVLATGLAVASVITVVPAIVNYAFLDGKFSYNEYGQRSRVGDKFSDDLEKLKRERDKEVKGSEPNDNAKDNYKEYVGFIKHHIGKIYDSYEIAGKRLLHLQILIKETGNYGPLEKEWIEKEIETFKADRAEVLDELESKIKKVAKYLDAADRDAILQQIRTDSPVMAKMPMEISDVLDEKANPKFVGRARSSAVGGISPPAIDPAIMGVGLGARASPDPGALARPRGAAVSAGVAHPPVDLDPQFEAQIREFINLKGGQALASLDRIKFLDQFNDLVNLNNPNLQLLEEFLNAFRNIQPFGLLSDVEKGYEEAIRYTLGARVDLDPDFIRDALELLSDKVLGPPPAPPLSPFTPIGADAPPPPPPSRSPTPLSPPPPTPSGIGGPSPSPSPFIIRSFIDGLIVDDGNLLDHGDFIYEHDKVTFFDNFLKLVQLDNPSKELLDKFLLAFDKINPGNFTILTQKEFDFARNVMQQLELPPKANLNANFIQKAKQFLQDIVGIRPTSAPSGLGGASPAPSASSPPPIIGMGALPSPEQVEMDMNALIKVVDPFGGKHTLNPVEGKQFIKIFKNLINVNKPTKDLLASTEDFFELNIDLSPQLKKDALEIWNILNYRRNELDPVFQKAALSFLAKLGVKAPPPPLPISAPAPSLPEDEVEIALKRRLAGLNNGASPPQVLKKDDVSSHIKILDGLVAEPTVKKPKAPSTPPTLKRSIAGGQRSIAGGRLTPSNPPTLSRSPRGLGLSPTPSSSSTPGSPTLSPMSESPVPSPFPVTPQPLASLVRSASKSNVAAESVFSGVPEAPEAPKAPEAPEAPVLSAISIASEAQEPEANPLLGRVSVVSSPPPSLEDNLKGVKLKKPGQEGSPKLPPSPSPAKANLQDALKSSLEQYRKFVQDEEEEEDDGNWS